MVQSGLSAALFFGRKKPVYLFLILIGLTVAVLSINQRQKLRGRAIQEGRVGTPEIRHGIETASLSFKIQIEGIIAKRPNLPLTVTLKQNGIAVAVYSGVIAVADDQGIYSAVISDVNPGTYDIVIKSPSHLARKFGNIVLTAGPNIQDFRRIQTQY